MAFCARSSQMSYPDPKYWDHGRDNSGSVRSRCRDAWRRECATLNGTGAKRTYRREDLSAWMNRGLSVIQWVPTTGRSFAQRRDIS